VDAFTALLDDLQVGISGASKEHSASGGGFYVAPIPRYPVFQIGSAPGSILFVINDSNLLTREFSGEILRVRTGLQCALKAEGESKVRKIALIELLATEGKLVSAFLSVIAAMLLRSTESKEFSIEEFVDSLIDIFSKTKSATLEDAQGLFGELVAISVATDKFIVLNGWRNFSEDRFDFSIENQRVEVKTTTGLRKHHFSHEQLSPPSGISVFVCSIQTNSSEDGMTVGGLLEKIIENISDNELRYLLYKKAYGKIDLKIDELNFFKFDYKSAVSSLKFYRSNDIPRILSIDQGVSDIRFVSDLQSSPALFGDGILEIKGFGCS
jgi:hypothetical protein